MIRSSSISFQFENHSLRNLLMQKIIIFMFTTKAVDHGDCFVKLGTDLLNLPHVPVFEERDRIFTKHRSLPIKTVESLLGIYGLINL